MTQLQAQADALAAQVQCKPLPAAASLAMQPLSQVGKGISTAGGIT